MAWGLVDDGFYDHPKAHVALSRGVDGLAALGLWSLALSYAKKHANPERPDQSGYIPRAVARRLIGGRNPDKYAAILVGARVTPDGAGLWEDAGEFGWRFHDFPYWQDFDSWAARTSKAQKAANSRWKRESPSGYRNGNGPDAAVLFTGGDLMPGAMPGACEPHAPSNAIPKPKPKPLPTPQPQRSKPSAQALARFSEFWALYPRKVGKVDAEKAWGQAITGGADVDAVLAGVARYARDPNLPPKTYIPHPATWLRRGSWEDEPLPPRFADQPSRRPGSTAWDDRP